MRILLIEHDKTSGVGLILKAHDLHLDAVPCVEEAIDCARTYRYDVVVLDQDGQASGQSAVQQLRAARIAAPVIILSAQVTPARAVQLLNSGADDCMSKPICSPELVARVRALARRAHGHATPTFVFGPMTLDMASKTVAVNGNRIALSRKEYQLLETLSLRQGIAVTRETLINQIYRDGQGPDSPIIELYVYRLRKKLAAVADGQRFIETVHDGYMLPRAA